jgi:hypothetical protein
LIAENIFLGTHEMTTKIKMFNPIACVGLWALLMLSSFTTLAGPYLTAGGGFSNAGSYMGTIGVGYKVTDWLRIEADTRKFSKSVEYGQSVTVGPLIVINDGASPPNYQCDPCHNEQPEYDVKTSGNVISALFTTPDPNAFAYVRLGMMYRTDETTWYPTNVYTQDPTATVTPNPAYTNAGPTTTTISSTQRIIGIGVSGHGFYVEITGYGSTPGIYINHDLFTSIIGYRMEW